MNSFMSINSTTWLKWTDSLKGTSYKKLIQDETENVNSVLCTEENKIVAKKTQGSGWLHRWFLHTFEKEIMPSPRKRFLIYHVSPSITLMPKLIKDMIRKKAIGWGSGQPHPPKIQSACRIQRVGLGENPILQRGLAVSPSYVQNPSSDTLPVGDVRQGTSLLWAYFSCTSQSNQQHLRLTVRRKIKLDNTFTVSLNNAWDVTGSSITINCNKMIFVLR